MKVSFIGTGTWGSALAQVLVDNGHSVILYGRDESQIEDINNNHQNKRYFGPDFYLDEKIKATNNLKEAIEFSSTVVLAVPTVAMRSVLNEIKPLLTKKTLFINTAKGFDPETDERISVLIREVIPGEFRYPIVSLIGPSHAEEVIIRLLTLITATSSSQVSSRKVQKLFSNDYFRVYTQKDEVGAEIGVAMKNSIAIASGIIQSLGYGDNARAALVTRGLVEILRVGMYFGGKKETFMGLTGLGDLMVTCNSIHSRNFMAGVAIGKDDSAKHFLETNEQTVEGIRTTEVLHQISLQYKLYTPIVNASYSVLYEDKKPSLVVKELMLSPLKPE